MKRAGLLVLLVLLAVLVTAQLLQAANLISRFSSPEAPNPATTLWSSDGTGEASYVEIPGKGTCRLRPTWPLLERVANLAESLQGWQLPHVTLYNDQLELVIRPNQWSFTATLKPGGETFRTLSGATNVKIRRLVRKTQDEAVFEGKLFPLDSFQAGQRSNPPTAS